MIVSCKGNPTASFCDKTAAMHLGPLVFKEILVPKPWGGRALARVAGKELPGRELIGESWEIADHPNGVSVIKQGPLAGRTLREVMRAYGRSLLGRNPGKMRFPLLVKLIDASKRVSVQVHPDDACARAMRLRDNGKTEAWYVLESRRGGRIIAGLKSHADIRRLREIAQSGEIASRLDVIRPRRGEAWLCAAGVPHALGPGVIVLEVQQNSDATFRLYDWGRVGTDGRPRRLHLEKAVRAVGHKTTPLRRARPMPLKRMPFKAVRLLACGEFVADRWSIPRQAARTKGNRFEILHVIKGDGTLCESEWPAIRLRKGVTVLVPACVARYEMAPAQRLEIVRLSEPE